MYYSHVVSVYMYVIKIFELLDKTTDGIVDVQVFLYIYPHAMCIHVYIHTCIRMYVHA